MTVLTRFHSDESEGRFHVQRVQDVEDIVEVNKWLQGEKQTWAGDWHHIGEIPCVIIERWMTEDGCNPLAMSGDEFGKYIKRKLRDPDNAAWRVSHRANL
jgi:hypothetical protein